MYGAVKHTHEMMIDDNAIEDIAGIVLQNALFNIFLLASKQ